MKIQVYKQLEQMIGATSVVIGKVKHAVEAQGKDI